MRLLQGPIRTPQPPIHEVEPGATLGLVWNPRTAFWFGFLLTPAYTASVIAVNWFSLDEGERGSVAMGLAIGAFLTAAALALFPAYPPLYVGLLAAMYLIHRVEIGRQYNYITRQARGRFVWDAWHRPLWKLGLPIAAALVLLFAGGAFARRF